MKHIFVINPKAGKKDVSKTVTEEVKNNLSEDQYIIYITKSPGDAKGFVKEYCDNNQDDELRFYSCGGDGTLNEIVNGSFGYKNVSVACYPSGSGNDFIKYFKGDKNKYLNIENLIKGKEVIVDILKYNDGFVLNICNMGFDADVGEKMVYFKRKPLITGKGAYILGVFAQFFSKMPHHFKLTVDGIVVFEGEALLCALANAICYGGGFYCTPRAKVDDGIIDIVLVKKISRLAFIKMIGDYKKGKHLDNPKIMKHLIYAQGKQVVVESTSVLNFTVDGEMGKTNKLTIDIVEKAVRFVIPSDIAF